MKNPPSHLATLALSLGTASLLACGGGSGNSGTDAGPDSDGSVDTDGGNAGDYQTLITGTWTKGPGADSYWCSYKTLTEDMYITGFDQIAPLGTHHTVLGIAQNYNGPDKEEACGVNTVGETLLYASGVGTEPFDLPAGVALKVEAGQTLLLQLHLFNATDNTIDGLSGTRVKSIAPEEVEHEAEFLFAGTFNINVPGNGQDTTAKGGCTMTQDSTIFALWPHMHQVGKHMKIERNSELLLDKPYDFNEQVMYPIDPIAVDAGDKINVTCTWNNPVGSPTKTFGDTSEDEMCFGGIYRYPAQGLAFGFCTQ